MNRKIANQLERNARPASSTAQTWEAGVRDQSAVLRNENNEHLYLLDGAEVDTFLWLATKGEVEQLKVRRKGRDVLVFRLKPKPKPQPQILSGSVQTACDLTEKDSKGMAGLNGKPNCFQIERWMGYGLIPAH